MGYVFAVALGMVDFTPVLEASWFKVPNFSAPVFELDPILYMIPIAIAPAIEHIGDMLAISHVSGENFLKKARA